MKYLYGTAEWEVLHARVLAWKAGGMPLVFTNGCFDILHEGHLALLVFAKEQRGKVVVGLNTDRSVRKLKGKDRPVHTGKERAKALMDSGYIDAVVLYDEPTPKEITDLLEPDILIKGDDYRFETIVGAPEVRARGGKVLIFPRIRGYSTTDILQRSGKNNETNTT